MDGIEKKITKIAILNDILETELVELKSMGSGELDEPIEVSMVACAGVTKWVDEILIDSGDINAESFTALYEEADDEFDEFVSKKLGYVEFE